MGIYEELRARGLIAQVMVIILNQKNLNYQFILKKVMHLKVGIQHQHLLLELKLQMLKKVLQVI